MQIDTSPRAPKIIDLNKVVIVRGRKTWPLLNEVVDLFEILKKHETKQEGKSSQAQRGLDYIKANKKIAKSELRGAIRRVKQIEAGI